MGKNLIRFIYSLLIFNAWRILFLRLLGIRIGDNCFIARSVYFYTFRGLSIGDCVRIEWGCVLDSRGGLKIGDGARISPMVTVLTQDHDINNNSFPLRDRAVTVNNEVVIFFGCVILPGVVLGHGSIIAAGTVVHRSVGAWDVVGTNGQNVIGKRAPLTDGKNGS
ncbi:acyltransferase [Luminiphilus syltensis]|uniref:acyltransferase n=1 Tax=Luminiphilus syltensis TaxID=1341119 RepID=UPI00389968E5